MDESKMSHQDTRYCAREPSFTQKRKQTGHDKKFTNLTEYQAHDEVIPTNKALLYKAGYRRVHFDMPTEYRMQYGYPQADPSPIMKASGVQNTHAHTDNDLKKEYKHTINGAHINGHTHMIVKEPPLHKRGGCSKEIKLDKGKKERTTISNEHSQTCDDKDSRQDVELLDGNIKKENVGSSCIISHNHPTRWVTEYSSNFGSPLQMKYVNGIWQGVNRPETLIKSPRIVVEQKQNYESDDPCNPSSANSWFDQVLELRKKVKEFKFRGNEGTDPSFDSNAHHSDHDDIEIESIESSSTTCTGGDGGQSSVTSGRDSPAGSPDPSIDDHSKDQRHQSEGVRVCQYPNCTKCLPKDHLKPAPVVQKPVVQKPHTKHSLKQQPVPKRLPADRFVHVPSLPIRPTSSSSKKIVSRGQPSRSALPRTATTAPKKVTKSSHQPTPPSLPCSMPTRASTTCNTCGAKPATPSYQHPVDCGVCNYSQPSRQALSPSFKKSIPICPPSCPNSTNSRMESISLSPVSVSSSCSVASEILERAKQRNVWKY